mmetsp:Transcript_17346/g.41789  ORF Transcript_17346/g.41789 Transcript_17346/m.41789 type:complete len:147 (+) Transcript_17346:196-636(+)
MPWRELIFKADGTVGVPASWNTWKAPAGAKIVQDDLLDLPEAMERLASDAASLSARSPQGLIGSKINWETTALCFPDDAAVKPEDLSPRTKCTKLKTPWREGSTGSPAALSPPKLAELPFPKCPAYLLSHGAIEDRFAKRAGLALA